MVSIVTPSFNQSQWLHLAVASVADQEGVEVEHIIQDALSTDGTHEWLHRDGRVRAFFEKDAGMYDAINRGLQRVTGDICAYLNCDEQYLPGALARVTAAFAQDPNLDVLLAGTIVVDAKGEYVCSRPPLLPSARQVALGRMYSLTSSIFFRMRLVKEKGVFFDSSYRIVGDLEWFGRVLRANASIQLLHENTSTFADLGNNMALNPGADSERERLVGKKGRPSPLLREIMTTLHRLHRFRSGHYNLKPFEYAIYTLDSPDQRRTFAVAKPTGIWANRL